MKAGLFECHGHLFMDGTDYRDAAARHAGGPDEGDARRRLAALKKSGVVYFRDGGDPFGVSLYARKIAAEYGVELVSPAFAIHRRGRYGSLVGRAYGSLSEYRALVAEAKGQGCDFIKLMFSGIVTFEARGGLSCPPLPGEEMAELVKIAHGEGFAVMAHCNGKDAVKAALEAGADSIEHGCFMDGEGLRTLAESGALWVPTLAALAAFRGRPGFNPAAVDAVLSAQLENVRGALLAGALVASGSDSGAAGVPHGQGAETELRLLREAAGPENGELLLSRMEEADGLVRRRFRFGAGR